MPFILLDDDLLPPPGVPAETPVGAQPAEFITEQDPVLDPTDKAVSLPDPPAFLPYEMINCLDHLALKKSLFQTFQRSQVAYHNHQW